MIDLKLSKPNLLSKSELFHTNLIKRKKDSKSNKILIFYVKRFLYQLKFEFLIPRISELNKIL